MAKINIFVFVALCFVFGVGLIDARFNDVIPQGFWKNDPSFELKPKHVETHGKRKVFTFGHKHENAEEIDSFTKSFEWDTAQDVDFEGGYPELFNGGIVDKLTYATISIESDDDKSGASFVHFTNDQEFAKYIYFKYNLSAKNTKTFKYEVRVFA